MHAEFSSDALTQLIDRYCEVWSEPDGSRRRALLSTLWAQDATYTDPAVHTATPDELLAHMAGVHSRRGPALVMRTSPVDTHHGVARFTFRVVHADGSTLRQGLDIAWASAEGDRLRRVIGFFD